MSSADEKQLQWEAFANRARGLLKSGNNALRRLSGAEIQALIDDYQRITADLSRARSMGAPRQTLDTLNRLAVMGHNVLYGAVHMPSPTREPWWVQFPQAVRRATGAVGLASFMLFVPMLISFFVVQWYPHLGFDLVPPGFYSFDPTSAEHFHEIPSLQRPMTSSSIITNNIQVTLMAFGLGLTGGIGTTFVLVFNGLHVGTVAGWMAHHGKGRALLGWILPHGSTELLAIALAGAAGYLLAGALLMPGLQRRADALKSIARQAMTVQLGVMGMLVIAGLIEGFVSPSSLPFELRLIVLGGSLFLWLAYFIGVGKEKSVPPSASQP